MDDEWDGLVHELIFSILFSTHPHVLQDSKKDPISVFLILLNMNPHDGNFASCSTICSRMSGLLYVFRLVAIREICVGRNREIEEDEDVDLAQGGEFK